MGYSSAVARIQTQTCMQESVFSQTLHVRHVPWMLLLVGCSSGSKEQKQEQHSNLPSPIVTEHDAGVTPAVGLI